MTRSINTSQKESGINLIPKKEELRRGKMEDIIKSKIEGEIRKELEEESNEFGSDLHNTGSYNPTGDSPVQVLKKGSYVKSEFLMEVENILAEGLGDIYNRMDEDTKLKFKVKGEETARKIERYIASGKAAFKKILGWIKDWLKMIPGVNKFFLEQEAKIKTDKILAMVGQEL